MSLIRGIPAAYVVAALLIEALLLSLHRAQSAAELITESIVVHLLINLVYIVSITWTLRHSSRQAPAVWPFVLICGLAFRLTVWPLFPWLSEDVYRYRWEGKLQSEGGNPYQSRPADPDLAGLQDTTFERVGSKDFKAGYGPLLELMEHWTYRLVQSCLRDPFAQVFWFKFPAALFDCGIVCALSALLAKRDLLPLLPVYVWSPLPIFEFWGNGHNDAIPVFFIVLALLLAGQQRWAGAFSAVWLAAAAKLWPVLLLPAFLRQAGWPRSRLWQPLVFIPVGLALAAPYWSGVEENIQFLSGFVGGWRNNDSFFGLILYLAKEEILAKRIALGLIGLASLSTYLLWSKSLEARCLFLIVTILAISANVHPWYLTWFLPLLPFHPLAPLLLWQALMPLSYSVLFAWNSLGVWNGSEPGRWLIYGPVCAVSLISLGIWQKKQNGKK